MMEEYLWQKDERIPVVTRWKDTCGNTVGVMYCLSTDTWKLTCGNKMKGYLW